MVTIINYNDEDTIPLLDALKELKCEYRTTHSEPDIIRSEKIIFMGGADIDRTIKQLHLFNLLPVLRICKKPILGIGLGMQILADYYSFGKISCLGIVPLKIESFNHNGDAKNLGWRKIKIIKQSDLFKGIKDGDKFFFSHKNYMPLNEYTTSSSEFTVPFSSSIEKNNFYGVQFHPETSGEQGLKLLENFIAI